jgi:hypothetical protein
MLQAIKLYMKEWCLLPRWRYALSPGCLSAEGWRCSVGGPALPPPPPPLVPAHATGSMSKKCAQRTRGLPSLRKQKGQTG